MARILLIKSSFFGYFAGGSQWTRQSSQPGPTSPQYDAHLHSLVEHQLFSPLKLLLHTIILRTPIFFNKVTVVSVFIVHFLDLSSSSATNTLHRLLTCMLTTISLSFRQENCMMDDSSLAACTYHLFQDAGEVTRCSMMCAPSFVVMLLLSPYSAVRWLHPVCFCWTRRNAILKAIARESMTPPKLFRVYDGGLREPRHLKGKLVPLECASCRPNLLHPQSISTFSKTVDNPWSFIFLSVIFW